MSACGEPQQNLQFGEHLQTGEVFHSSDVVVLHVQMSQVEGEAQVANLCDLIVVQVENSEVSAQGDVALEQGGKREIRNKCLIYY